MGNTKRNVVQINLDKPFTQEDFEKAYKENGPCAFIINVTRDMVVERKCQELHSVFDVILDIPEAGECNYLLNIKGYDYKLAELWKVPEVVRYIKEAFKYRPIVLSKMGKETIALVFAAHSAKTNKTQTGFYLSEDRAKDFLMNIYNTTPDKPNVFRLARRVEKLLDIYVIP